MIDLSGAIPLGKAERNAQPTPALRTSVTPSPVAPGVTYNPTPKKSSRVYNYTPKKQEQETPKGKYFKSMTLEEEQKLANEITSKYPDMTPEDKSAKFRELGGLIEQKRGVMKQKQDKQDFINEGAFAGTLARTSPQEDRGTIGEGIITRQEANQIEEGSSMRENTKKTLSNLVPSAVNVADDIETMILNPIDTLGGLGKLMVGGLLEGGQAVNELVTGDDSSETYKQVYKDMKNKGGLIGWLGETLESSDETAGMVGQALTDRYGSYENFQKTLVEDPVGLFSDLAGVISGGATIVGKSSTALSRAGVQTSRLSKLAKTADKVQKFADKVDPYSAAFTKLGEGVTTGVQKAQELGTKVKDMTTRGLDRVKEDVAGLSKADIEGIKNNPYQAEYWNEVKQTISESGVPQSTKEMIRKPVEQLTEDLIQVVDDKKKALSDSGPLYNEIRGLDVNIDITPAHSKLESMLNNSGIKVKRKKNGDIEGLDFTNSKFINSQDTSAIQSVFDRIMGIEEVTPDGVLNLRQAIDSASKYEGRPIPGTKFVRKMRGVVDEIAKEQVPGLKEADALYSKKIKELDQITDGLTYRQGNRKGQYRDNLVSIVKNLGGENRAIMRKRIKEFMPDIEERIDAINNLPKLVEAYNDTPMLSKQTKAGAGALAGGALYGIEGAIGGAILGYITDGYFKNLRKGKIDEIFSSMSPEAINKLKTINAKIEANKTMNATDEALIDVVRNKIEKSGSPIIKSIEGTQRAFNNPQQALPEPTPQAVTPDGSIQNPSPISPDPTTPQPRQVIEQGTAQRPTSEAQRQQEKDLTTQKVDKQDSSSTIKDNLSSTDTMKSLKQEANKSSQGKAKTPKMKKGNETLGSYERKIKSLSAEELKSNAMKYEDSMDSQDLSKILDSKDPAKEILTLLRKYKKSRSDLNAKNDVVLMDYTAEQYNRLLDIVDPNKYVVRKAISKNTYDGVNF